MILVHQEVVQTFVIQLQFLGSTAPVPAEEQYTMCLDYGPFKLVNEEEETDLDNIATILVQDEGLKLIDSFGKISLLSGRISEIDLLNQRIVLV